MYIFSIPVFNVHYSKFAERKLGLHYAIQFSFRAAPLKIEMPMTHRGVNFHILLQKIFTGTQACWCALHFNAW